MKTATLSDPRNATLLTGITEVAVPAICSALFRESEAPVTIIFTRSHSQSEQWSENLEFFSKSFFEEVTPKIEILPDLPALESDDPRSFETECDRLATLTAFKDHKSASGYERPLVIFTTPRGFFHPVPALTALSAGEIRIRVGGRYEFRAILDRLAGQLRYDSEVLCENPGQFAVRGGLIDVYPVNAQQPYRIDFFGDEIEAIKSFDPTTQRSLENHDAISISSIQFRRAQVREHNIFGYLPDHMRWIFSEPGCLIREFPACFHFPEEIPSPFPNFQTLFDHRRTNLDKWLALTDLDAEDPIFGTSCGRRAMNSEPLSNYRTLSLESELGIDRVNSEQEARKRFLLQVLEWQRESCAIYCVTNNEGEENRLKEILHRDDELKLIHPHYLRGSLRDGFRITFNHPDDTVHWSLPKGTTGVVVLSDSEIFGRYRSSLAGARRRKLPSRAQVDQLLDFSDLVEGDPLVHLQHGICFYRGLTTMDVRGRNEEVISLEFDDEITLHLPLSESHLLTRYVGLTKIRPKLGRLGTRSWEKTRRAAEKATLDFAADLLNLQAKRNLMEGHAFSPDSDWQVEFEQSFIYRETPDQLQAIEDAKSDLELPRPMDRLICGDVGYGKTEVALRASFKAVMDGMQVAVLVPTTILAQQHLNTFRERVADYPITVEMLSRFRTKSQQSQILSQLRTGRVDIIIGTHRLLSGDISFNRLGLLIIDEEHRFGVGHKEKLKRLKENVDVLNMSATPIPRTLYLALVGARDLSVIETPPLDRLPIHTVVKSYNVDLIKDSISYEIARGGQVFYLHNRVQTIDSVARRLQDLLPDLRIAIGHGQMEDRVLEDIMTRFVAGEFDVLVCTTIIESGLDIPNCNTIIIEGADRFGLSQLYQLRGRVGRFKRQAYAYLLLHRHTQLIDQARKRLSAIRQYNQLGAGFKIAMRDLELRGAGNLLGAEQSGHIAGVGFELYCQLLRQSISRLKGDKGADTIRATLYLDFVVMGEGENRSSGEVRDGFAVLKEAELARSRIETTEAYLPSSYLEESRLRIDFYRQLAMAPKISEVREIGIALEDRFGPYPEEVQALILVTEIRCLAEEKGILSVETEGDRLKCLRASSKKDDYIRIENRFPRLKASAPILRLKEIRTFLKRSGSKDGSRSSKRSSRDALTRSLPDSADRLLETRKWN